MASDRWLWRWRIWDTRPVGIRYSLTGPHRLLCRRSHRRYRYRYRYGTAGTAERWERVPVGRVSHISCARVVRRAVQHHPLPRAARTVAARACGAICRRGDAVDDDDGGDSEYHYERRSWRRLRRRRRSLRARGLALAADAAAAATSISSTVARARRRPHTRELSRVHV